MKDFEPIEYKPIKEAEGLKTPPLDWYYGIGRKDIGIDDIGYSDKFQCLGDGCVFIYFMIWRRETTPIPHEPISPYQERRIQIFSSLIRNITGFEPEEIFSTQKGLEETYKGAQNTPFPYELY